MSAVIQPNYGLYYDRPEIAIPPKGLADGMNFRIKNGQISTLNLGWAPLSPTNAWTLDGPVMAIISFIPRNATESVLFLTPKTLYKYDSTTDDGFKLNPIYATGTVAVSGTAVTGVGTLWTANAKPGDQITFGTAVGKSAKLTWFTVLSVTDNTHLVLTATAGTIGAGAAYTLSKAFQGTKHNLWDYDIFTLDGDSGNDQVIMTNGVDFPVSWDGVASAVTLHSEMGFTCGTVTAFSDMMTYGNLTQGGINKPTSMINSDLGLPFHAGSASTGVSGQFLVHDGFDPVIQMYPMADYLAIYSQYTVTMVQFIGAPLVFAFRQSVHNYGIVGLNAIADFGNKHEYLSLGSQFSFDGVGLRESNSHVFREAIRRSDPGRREFSFAYFDELNGDLIWSMPSNTDPSTNQVTADRQSNFAYVEQYLEDVPQGVETPFSQRQFPFISAGPYRRKSGFQWNQISQTWQQYNFAWNDQFFQLNFPQILVGDDFGKVYILSEAQKGNGVALPSFVRFGRMATGSGRERALLRRVYPFTTQTNISLTLTTNLADYAAGPFTNVTTVQFNTALPEGQNSVPIFHRGRFASLQFGDPAGGPWVLAGYDYDITGDGAR